MNTKELQEIIELVLNRAAYFLAVSVLTIFVGLAIKNFVSSLLCYLKARMDDVGVGTIVEIGSCSWRLQKIKFSYVQLVKLDEERSGIVKRIPLAKWEKMDKTMYYNGHPMRRKTDVGDGNA